MPKPRVIADNEDFPIKPADIDASKHLWEAFGNGETETSAGYIVRLMQEKGRWQPFTYAEINDFYQRTCTAKHPGDFTFNREKGSIEFKDGVLFDLGSWKISANGARILKTIADTQKSNVLKVVGHADKKPITREATKKALDTDTNMELSCRRAVAVMGELLKNGIRESQIASVEGHGTEPTSNHGVSRCVEIFIVKGASVAPTSFNKTLPKPVKK